MFEHSLIGLQERKKSRRGWFSLPMGLDQAAIDAVRMWRYKPATLNGRPVKVYFNLTVNFQLQR